MLQVLLHRTAKLHSRQQSRHRAAQQQHCSYVDNNSTVVTIYRSETGTGEASHPRDQLRCMLG